MNKLVLYCKSYDKDVHRAKILLDSIVQFNEDDIPFYISVPESDIELFKKIIIEFPVVKKLPELLMGKNSKKIIKKKGSILIFCLMSLLFL